MSHQQSAVSWQIHRNRVIDLHGNHIIVCRQLPHQLQRALTRASEVADDAYQVVMAGQRQATLQNLVELIGVFGIGIGRIQRLILRRDTTA
ncbi:hypothetical protein D3C86_1417110 [compost metagenome]